MPARLSRKPKANDAVDAGKGQKAMGEVTVTVHGNQYRLACRDGDEKRIEGLAADIDRRAHEISRQLGAQGEARLMLLVALLLADELADLREGAGQVGEEEAARPLVAAAERIEATARTLAGGDERA
ncbi:MAG: cell division protein ZapA [Alphaproteobacteria bacterium]|nr:MAG: cell division protein ZapA [Alphaproteobacteria bacterium]